MRQHSDTEWFLSCILVVTPSPEILHFPAGPGSNLPQGVSYPISSSMFSTQTQHSLSSCYSCKLRGISFDLSCETIFFNLETYESWGFCWYSEESTGSPVCCKRHTGSFRLLSGGQMKPWQNVSSSDLFTFAHFDNAVCWNELFQFKSQKRPITLKPNVLLEATNYYLHQKGHIFSLVCLSVSEITGKTILARFSRKWRHGPGPRKNQFNAGADPNDWIQDIERYERSGTTVTLPQA